MKEYSCCRGHILRGQPFLIAVGFFLVVLVLQAGRYQRGYDETQLGTSSVVVLRNQSQTITFDNRTRYYAIAQTDRSGSSIFDLLKLDAYAFRNNGVAGGGCGEFERLDPNNTGGVRSSALFAERLGQKLSMLRAMGLEDTIHFDCPTPQDLEEGRAKVLKRDQYKDTITLLTTEWHSALQARSTFYNQYGSRSSGDALQIAVHVRRGDYDPCHPQTGKKYLPNEYYLTALDKYLPDICHASVICNVTVYSDTSRSRSRAVPADFSPFIQRNYTLDLTSSPEDVWRAFIQADALFVSRSSFSMVPAFLNRNQVIFPHDYYRLDNMNVSYWSTPSRMTQILSDEALLELQIQYCPQEDI